MLDGLELDQHYARTDATGTHEYLTDALNSTLALTDSAGAISTSYRYSPFGSTITTGQTSTNPYQYVGGMADSNNLTYLRARYLSGGQNRFLSPDPSGLAGDGPSSYAYGADSPTNANDPLGLCDCDPGSSSKTQSGWDTVKDTIRDVVGKVSKAVGTMFAKAFGANPRVDQLPEPDWKPPKKATPRARTEYSDVLNNQAGCKSQNAVSTLAVKVADLWNGASSAIAGDNGSGSSQTGASNRSDQPAPTLNGPGNRYDPF